MNINVKRSTARTYDGVEMHAVVKSENVGMTFRRLKLK